MADSETTYNNQIALTNDLICTITVENIFNSDFVFTVINCFVPKVRPKTLNVF